ncbi:putative protein BEARSKIN2-like [Cocos nucifera]|nr:putative protein BEARSKIN2-like [Cocos nucifera]
MNATASHNQPRPPSSQYIHPLPYYSQLPMQSYSHGQVQDLLSNHRPTAGYDFSVLPGESSAMVKAYEGDLEGGGNCEGMQHVGEGIREQSLNDWTVLDGIDRRFGSAGGAAVQQILNHISGRRGGEMDLWGYGK